MKPWHKNWYRGREKSGEWRYGYYQGPSYTDYGTYIRGNEMIDGEETSAEDLYEVIYETLGQHTNCRDAHGKSIWENDIVRYNEGSMEKPVYCGLTVKYIGNGFYAVGNDGFSDLKVDISVEYWRCEVIGNAFEGVTK